MKSSHKSTILIIALLFCVLAAPAAAAQDESATTSSQPRFRIGAYFEGWMLNDENLKSFFGHNQRNLPGFEASVHALANIDVWTSYRIYSDETKTSFYGNTDKFRINAASIGLLYRPVVWSVLEPFVGAGLEIYSYSEKIEGDTDIPGTSGNAVGFHIQAGTHVNITKFLAGKLFFRINGVKKTLANALPDGSTELDLGGKEFGAGLVFKF
jgi:opacity protein-like surface antigen